MLPYIDALHVMGYSETGSKSTGWRSYDFLRAAAGNFSSKLLIGVPSHMSKWEKASVQEHLDWIAKNHPVGLAIWDAQLKVDFNGTGCPTLSSEKKMEIKLRDKLK